MGENSAIEWTDRTRNFWSGCTKVSPGCANCYAENLAKRNTKTFGKWGRGAVREWHGEGARADLMKWNTRAVMAKTTLRVFPNSMSDWLDNEVPAEWLAHMLDTIRITPNLIYQLLTKRPENWRERLIAASVRMLRDVGEPGDQYTDEAYLFVKNWLLGNPPANVWIGTTVEDQERADSRIPHLLDIPAKVRFLSCEPLLGFTDIQQVGDDNLTIYWPLAGKAISDGMNDPATLKHGRIHWVICGGESGPKARPMHPDWARAIRDQFQAAGVPFFFKQWGEFAPCDPPVVTNIQGKLQATGSWRASDRYVECRETGQWVKRVGKKAAGRLLDGREWNEFPTGKVGA